MRKMAQVSRVTIFTAICLCAALGKTTQPACADEPIFVNPPKSVRPRPGLTVHAWAGDGLLPIAAEKTPAGPTLEQLQRTLPNPILNHRPELVRAYWGAWWWMDVNTEHRPGRDNIEPAFISAAYNGNAFAWDTSTMLLFARYAWKTRPTIVSMNNFYRNPNIGKDAKEWSIPHEILGLKTPAGTPPQIMAWAEWEHYLMTGDRERLKYAVPFLLKNYQTMREKAGPKLEYRRIGKGIELYMPGRSTVNNVASPLGGDVRIAVDTLAQMAHSALCLARMADVLGDTETAAAMRKDYDLHVKTLHERHWDAKRGTFLGKAQNGDFYPFYHASNFWPWLAEATTTEQDIEMLIALFDPTRFRQGSLVPTASFENVRWHAPKDGRHTNSFSMYSGFWLGSIWAPTNQVVIRGLRNKGMPMLAREVSLDMLRWGIEQPLLNPASQVPLEKTDFSKIGSYAEYTMPEFIREVGRDGKARYRLHQFQGDFVGWGGTPVVCGIVEELIGILPDASKQTITWRVNELPRHGLTNINLGAATIGLIARERKSLADPVVIEVNTDAPFTLRAELGSLTREKKFSAGQHTWEVGTYSDPMAGFTTTPADFSAQGNPIDPRWNIYGIKLGMTVDEVKKLARDGRWFNKPLDLLGHHYADRMTVYLEGKTFANIIFSAEGRAMMVWTRWAPDGESNDRRKALSADFGEPVAEWRHPDFDGHQYLVWGDSSTDVYGLPDNGTNRPSLLMYNFGKGALAKSNESPRHGGMRLWDPVGIAKMREGLRKVITHAVKVSQGQKQ